MTDREIMQQALEALQAVRDTPASADEIQRAWIVSDLLQRRLAQPEQEPVAWMYTSHWKGDERFITRYQSELTAYKADKVWPFYTTPPQRKPLTDEEIGKIAGETLDPWSCARAIEAAHGIKENT